MANTEQPSRELIQQVEHAHKEYISASKEYLAIAFKNRVLDR